MLKISLLFKKKQTLWVNNSRIFTIKNATFSVHYFHMNSNIWWDFQICISVPLISLISEDKFEDDPWEESITFWAFPVGNYMFKVDNRNTTTKCKICSKLTIKSEHISQLVLVFMVNFQQVNAGWVIAQLVW